ncbi:MAG: Glyoxalase/bleomycin resistance protein/dioxygenase [Cyanobacteria bacterium RYN_339]|nr:Glyoxalase/bleomycin resistance protein/dioxygenase [Cyanobacteria bacterium RYN_339]
MMTLNHLNLAVADPDRALPFYLQWFGFAEVLRLEDFVKVRDAAGFELSLTRAEEPRTYPPTFHFGFRLPEPADVLALHARMAAADVPIKNPLREAEDRVFFLCLDPDGHKIEVYWES